MCMVIGIDASRAFLRSRTGIEEYSYQVIVHLRKNFSSQRVILYIRSDQVVDFPLPETWIVKKLWAPRLWTQVRLSLEMLFAAPDILFVPAHTIPLIHPKHTFVTIHGLEYEFCPSAYSFWERWYMRISIRFSCWVASGILCVSENTKKDIMELYGVSEDRIYVVHEGFDRSATNTSISREKANPPSILFIGRLEERKNIIRIIEAFEQMKLRYALPHVLVLAGKPGYGYPSIQSKIRHSKFAKDILEHGYVSDEKKWELLKHADIFVFPTLYEGFGIPILEAQSVGTPVIASETSSLPEVGGDGALYVNPLHVEELVLAMKKMLTDEEFRSGIIRRAMQNTDRFSWGSCADEISKICQTTNS